MSTLKFIAYVVLLIHLASGFPQTTKVIENNTQEQPTMPEALRKKDINSPEELRMIKERLREGEDVDVARAAEKAVGRMARFIFDLGGDSSSSSYDTSSNSGFSLPSFGGGSGKTANLFNLNIDSNAVTQVGTVKLFFAMTYWSK